MSRSLPELWILRHGETEWNVEERLQGRLDSPLTETGIAQAQAQGAILRRELPEGVQVLSSPSGRAWRTAEIATEGLALPIAAEPALLEIDIGAWQGRTVAEIRAERPDIAVCDDPHLWKFTGPGCESLDDMQARLEALLKRLDRPSVLVTHGVTSRMMRCLVLGMGAQALSSVPGGQGVVHHLRDGVARILHP